MKMRQISLLEGEEIKNILDENDVKYTEETILKFDVAVIKNGVLEIGYSVGTRYYFDARKDSL